MSDVTMVIVSYNACDALALTVESFRKHHPNDNVECIILDNGSTDGAFEYAKGVADIVISGDNTMSHGENLALLCSLVRTPYVLTLDNDLEFTGPVLEMMTAPLESNEVYGSCLTRLWPFGTADIDGRTYNAQWSPNICCGLMKTERVHHILSVGVTFGYYFNVQRSEFFETGAMFWRVAKACGWRIEEIGELWERVKHYGSVSTLWLGPNAPMSQEAIRQREEIERRYSTIQSRLQLLRHT